MRGRRRRQAGWSDTEQVEWYVSRIGRLEPRLAGERMVADALPPAPRTVLDLGTGDGRLAALVLEERPSVEEVVAVDCSPPMLERARARFAGDPRVRVDTWDLRDPISSFGAFDLVVSGFAIHHLEDDRKQELYREIAALLAPGRQLPQPRGRRLGDAASATPNFLVAIGRTADDVEDRLSPVEDQLAWLRAAGLTNVDCLWRWRGFAVLAGDAP